MTATRPIVVFAKHAFPARPLSLPQCVITVSTYPVHTMRPMDIVRCMEFADIGDVFRGAVWMNRFDIHAYALGYQYCTRAVCLCNARYPTLCCHLPECGFVRNDLHYEEDYTDE